MIPNINTNNRDNLALLHLNIHSIFYKLDRFSNFLGSVALKFSVIGVCETRLDDSSYSCDIIGFNFIHNHRVGRTCLLYTSPSPRDGLLSRMPSSA